ncbi:MAG: transporter [Kiritimatiellae bacterium]|nr:transporter [Kiritimatiellia bacterium]
MKKIGLFSSLLFAAALPLLAESESVRSLFCRENRFPELGKWEVGGYASYRQLDEYYINQIDPKCFEGRYVDKKDKRSETTFTPYARYGVYDNLTLYSKVPIDFVSSDVKGSQAGFNDIAVGMELLAYEYTYRYPWVVPYIEVTFPTGNDRNYMGLGKVDPIFGIAVGTTTFDVYHWILDGRYDANAINDGRFEGAAAFIWDLSDQFSVLAEAKIMEKTPGSTKDVPAYFNGGISYRPSEMLTVNLYGGTSVNADENGRGTVKIAYNF